jgi:DNA-binding NarL/FixJ family response regulator
VGSDTIRVFLVDDHPLVRDWLKTLLQTEKDFEVIGEADEQAAALSSMVADPPDIAVVDLSLRRGSGLELIKSLRGKVPDVQVIVLSMHEEISDVERALRAGARGYVMKGASSGQIVPAIRWVHSGKIYATPEVFTPGRADDTKRSERWEPGRAPERSGARGLSSTRRGTVDASYRPRTLCQPEDGADLLRSYQGEDRPR